MTEIEAIKSIPWCARHLNAPDLVISVADCRHEKTDTADSLFSRSLKTADTVGAFVTFHRRPAPTQEQPAAAGDRRVVEFRAFVSVGDGLNGFGGVCHGGILATILDEIMAEHIEANQHLGAVGHPMLMTAYLNVRFLAPLPTPSTVMACSRLTSVDGRKYKFEAGIEGEDGRKMAECDALFIAVQGKM